jgi:hypothetical protein
MDTGRSLRQLSTQSSPQGNSGDAGKASASSGGEAWHEGSSRKCAGYLKPEAARRAPFDFRSFIFQRQGLSNNFSISVCSCAC